MSDNTHYEDITKNFEKNRDKNICEFEKYEPEWTCMADVQVQQQKWFWPGIIPDLNLCLFAGIGGIGKSLLLLYIISKTSSGEMFKACGFDHQLPHGSVILLSAEDDANEQIKPKLLAMEADTSKIYYIKSKTGSVSKKKKFLELDKDLYILEQKIKEIGDVRLIVIDPIAYFVGETKDHINSEVANFLQSLIDLARKYKLAIVLNKHLRKQASGARVSSAATNEVGGAGAWTNTPRKCWLITNHHDDPEIKLITQMKDNLSKKNTESLAYKISAYSFMHDGLNIETTVLVWLDQTISISADEAVSKETFEMSKLDTAIVLILKHLDEHGQSLLSNIQASLLKKGIKRATFLRAYPEFEKRYADILSITSGIKGAKTYMLKEKGVSDTD